MSDRTGIEWTAGPDGSPGATWNPIRGVHGKWSCVKVSPGCQNCYAEAMNVRFGGPRYTVGADELRLDEKALAEPLRWKKPRRVFVCSMTDLFEDRVKDEWIDRVFAVMALSQQHTFQVLTKRPARMHAHVFDDRCLYRTQAAVSDKELQAAHGRLIRWPLPNVWLGVSVEDQERADERIPLLLQTPAAVRFVSAEPLVGPVDLTHVREILPFGCIVIQSDNFPSDPHYDSLRGYNQNGRHTQLDWVIVGGESGPGARPMDLAWARTIVGQCRAAGVACFMKQDSGPRPGGQGRIPEELWIKEFPR